MTDADRIVDVEEGHAPLHPEWREEDGRLSHDWVHELQSLIDAQDAERLREMMAPLHEADAGDVIEALSRDERLTLIRLLGDAFDYNTLTEIDETIRVELLEALPNLELARGMAELDHDDAVYILEDMEEPDRDAIIALMPDFERLALRRSLDFPEDSAGRRMQTDFIALPPFWTVGHAIDYMRSSDDLPTEFYQLYVVDPGYNLLGTVPLDRILRSGRDAKIEDITDDQIMQVDANSDQEEAARLFERYDLVEVGVIDESHRLVGVLTVDDIVDVIHEEADEDIRRLAGVGDEEVSDSVWTAVRSRVTWLLVNLCTAILASMVIGMFDASLEQMVALAVLMPIVASMGGNAGTQTMTVTVRALSTQDLGRFNMLRLIRRETLVGAVNGIVFALVLGVVAALWFSNPALGIVIGIAMIVNMLAAGISGILIPLALDKVGIDPAIASSAFVTTVTDVVGFFAFLGLAAKWFGLM
ncbi:MAG: magnesium transporter [Hyphomicrobiaceae bacterium]|nr:magnesium transporter [Hyphomicrobiaceae bacterium]MCC0023622.1 magnesium transporter [Hyphomicrobiaceae bacterium]